jgi:hypothetical protein
MSLAMLPVTSATHLCAEDAVRIVGSAILDCLSRPGTTLAQPVRLRVGLIDPDCVLYVDTGRREVRLGAPGDAARADQMVAMNGDTAVRLCQGLVEVDAALELGEIAADAECHTLLRLIAQDGSTAAPAAYAV